MTLGQGQVPIDVEINNQLPAKSQSISTQSRGRGTVRRTRGWERAGAAQVALQDVTRQAGWPGWAIVKQCEVLNSMPDR